MYFRSLIATFLSVSLALPAGAAHAVTQDNGHGLKILVLSGNDAVNSIPTRKDTPPIIEVRDNNDRPVENARVVFSLPEGSGPGATFSNNQVALETVTNSRGQASPAGFRMNEIPGAFTIAVYASANGKTGSAEIRQTNSYKEVKEPRTSEKGGLPMKWIVIGGAGAAGLALGIYFAAHGGSSAAAASGITVTPGPITIGAPK